MPQKQELNPPLQRPNRPLAQQPWLTRLHRQRSSPSRSGVPPDPNPPALVTGSAKGAASTS